MAFSIKATLNEEPRKKKLKAIFRCCHLAGSYVNNSDPSSTVNHISLTIPIRDMLALLAKALRQSETSFTEVAPQNEGL
jgi:hypothetical protein